MLSLLYLREQWRRRQGTSATIWVGSITNTYSLQGRTDTNVDGNISIVRVKILIWNDPYVYIRRKKRGKKEKKKKPQHK